MSIKALLWALNLPVKTSTDRLLLIALADLSDDEGETEISVETLTRRCMVKRATVFNSIRRLEENEHLERVKQIDEKGFQKSNLYRLSLKGVQLGHHPGSKMGTTVPPSPPSGGRGSGVDDEDEKPDPMGPQIAMVWETYVEAREQVLNDRGLKVTTVVRTPPRRKRIQKLIRTYGVLMVCNAMRAIVFSPFHNGTVAWKGKMEPHLDWRWVTTSNGVVNQVEELAALWETHQREQRLTQVERKLTGDYTREKQYRRAMHRLAARHWPGLADAVYVGHKSDMPRFRRDLINLISSRDIMTLGFSEADMEDWSLVCDTKWPG